MFVFYDDNFNFLFLSTQNNARTLTKKITRNDIRSRTNYIITTWEENVDPMKYWSCFSQLLFKLKYGHRFHTYSLREIIKHKQTKTVSCTVKVHAYMPLK